MRRSNFALLAAAFFVPLASVPATPPLQSAQPPVPHAVVDVHAAIETVPVETGGDAADDPAIWVNPKDPARSVIIGTNKQRGLQVYALDGSLLQDVPEGRMNNVDLRAGFSLGGREVVLVTAGNRSGNTIAIYALDPETLKLANVAARDVKTASAYGSCMYRSAKTGKF